MPCHVQNAGSGIHERTVVEEEQPAKELREKGRIQYFYHSQDSTLPIRDVSNTQGKDPKPEPHIEIGAENYIRQCRARNIVAHLNSDEKYLFLVTTCRNRMEKQYRDKTFIVGYIEREKDLRIKTGDKIRRALKGKLFLFPFEKSIPYGDVFGSHFSPIRLVNETLTKELVDHRLPKYSEEERISFLRKCVAKIEELDENNKKEDKTCLVLRGETCRYQKECLRPNFANSAQIAAK